eukprot:350491-Chlamydomonas_euryale.AAC.7
MSPHKSHFSTHAHASTHTHAAAGHADKVLPLAFSAKMDEDADVAGVWKEVWEEGVSSEAGALRLYAKEIAASLAAGLAAPQWGQKRACADAVAQMAGVNGGESVAPFAPALAAALLSELGGRLWDGKEALPQALGALAAAAP